MHDVFAAALASVSARVSHVVVTALHGAAYMGRVCFASDGGGDTPNPGGGCVSCRPSDGIALSLRCGAPIYVAPTAWAAGAAYMATSVVPPPPASVTAARWAPPRRSPSPAPRTAATAAAADAARAALAAASFEAAFEGLRAGVAAAQDRFADAVVARDAARAVLFGARARAARAAAALEAALSDGRLEDVADLEAELAAAMQEVASESGDEA